MLMSAEFEAAVVQLVASLMNEDVARRLRFPADDILLRSKIVQFLSQVVLDITIARPLLAAVATNASHEEIWSALYDLIAASTVIQRPTPSITPTPAAPTPADENSEHNDANNDDTLIIHSLASQEGDQQTHKLLDPRIWEEIAQCTCRDVPEFFDKYFNGQKSSQEADRITREAMSRYQNNGWMGFPSPPAQAQVLEWFFQSPAPIICRSALTVLYNPRHAPYRFSSQTEA
jgi:hypothetical protein